jgi:hypothetical protein
MLGSRTSEIARRVVVGCVACVAPLACARGIDDPLDGVYDAAAPVTVGASAAVGPGAGGFAGSNASSAGGSSAVGAGGHAGTSVESGAGGSTGAMGGAGSSVTNGGGAGSGGDAGAGGAGGGGGVAGSSNVDGGSDASMHARPTGVRVDATSTPSGQQSASASGTAYHQSCATDEVVIGYTGTTDSPDAAMNQLRTFRAVCASLSISGIDTFAVNTTSKEILPVVGTMPGADQQTQLCPNDQVVIGFAGKSGSDIDQIVLLCAPLTIARAGSSYALSLGSETSRPPLGGPGGSPFAAIHCPAGQVATGNEGRAAFTINAFGLLCGTPTLVVTP